MSLSAVTENIMASRIHAFEQRYQLLTDPFEQVDALCDFCWEYIDTMEYTDLSYQKAALADDILKTIDYPRGQIKSHLNYAYYHWAKSNADQSLQASEKALELLQSFPDQALEASAWQLKTISHIGKGSYNEAFASIFKAIKLCEEQQATLSKGFINYTLGILYVETKDYEAALKQKLLSLEILKDSGEEYGIARALSGLATVYMLLGDYDAASQKFNEAAAGFRKTGHRIGLSRSLNDIGVLNKRKRDYEEAENFLKEAYAIRESLNHIQGMITSSYELGELKTETGHTEEAIKWLHKALLLARESKARAKECAIHKTLSQAFKLSGDMQAAYYHLEEYVNIQSAILGQETAQKLRQMETRMATERAEKEAEIERLKNVELKNAHDAIAMKNKDIMDSINYAKRLQEAILPPVSEIKEYLPDSFVLYKPKDIVAGDFYWAYALPRENEGPLYFLATADCTGHGVPGAFMSLLSASILNEVIIDKKITRPDLVLNETRASIIKALSSNGAEESKDGMDGVLCVFDLERMQLQYAAANNNFYIVRDNQLLEQPADKMPVGSYHEKHLPFTLYTVPLKKGDMIYTLTDGYADQFGGLKGKKFKYKQLENLLLASASLPVHKQQAVLEETFNQWKGDFEQVDDMLVIGVRI